MTFVKDELGQMVAAISKNLFLKKDQKNLNKMKSLYPFPELQRADKPQMKEQSKLLRRERDRV